jgi:uncharacterized protein YceK
MKKLVLSFILLSSLSGCADVKNVLRGSHDVAKNLCAIYYSDKQGISLDEAAREICVNEEKLRPWIDHVLSLKKNGVNK